MRTRKIIQQLCNFLLDQKSQYYLNFKSEVYCVFLDATKAFDLIDHEKLLKTLNKNEICPLFIRVIMVLYKFNNAIIQYYNLISSSFSMETGVNRFFIRRDEKYEKYGF